MITEIIKIASKTMHIQLDLNRYLVVGNAFSKISIFLYLNNSKLPNYVIKVPFTDDSLKKCITEYTALDLLKKTKINNIVSAFPICEFEYCGNQCFVQTAVYGYPLLEKMHTFIKKPNNTLFELATDNLIEIYKASRNEVNCTSKSYSLCFQHGDFWLGNLAKNNNSIVLHDLEFFNEYGFPLYDILHFGVYYYRVNDNIGKVGKNLSNSASSDNNDRRIFDLSIKDVENILFVENKFSNIMKKSINKYIFECEINKNDALQLIRDYIVIDRGITGIKDSNFKKIFE